MNIIVKNAFNNRSRVQMDQAYLTHMSMGHVLNGKSSKKDPFCDKIKIKKKGAGIGH